MFHLFEWFYPTFSAFIFCYAAFVFYLFIRKKNAQIKKRLYTYELCNKDPRNYELLFNTFNIQERVHQDIDQWRKIVSAPESINSDFLQSQQIEAIRYFDKLAIGLKNSLLDEDILFDYYYRYFNQAYNATKFTFLRYNNEFNVPNLYIEYFKLLNKWNNRGARNHV